MKGKYRCPDARWGPGAGNGSGGRGGNRMATDKMAKSSSSGDCSSSGSSSSTGVGSILDRLKAVAPSELSRKRKVGTNPPPKGKNWSSDTAVEGHLATLSRSAPAPSTATTSPSPGTALLTPNSSLT